MRNRLLKIISLCALAVLLLPLAITFGQGGNTLSWDYDTTGDLFCSATKTDVCITGFDLYYAVGAGTPAITARVGISACALQAGSTVLYTCTAPVPAVARYGNISWTARAIAKDGTAEIPSIDSNSVVKVRQPRPPAGLRTP